TPARGERIVRDSSRSVAVVGGGSWGTALAIHLARAGFQVPLWAHDPERAHEMVAHRENRTYLADFRLPEGVHPSSDLEQVLRREDLVIWVVPARFCRELFRRAASLLHRDRKSTRLNSSHVSISYAVFCLK